ncbi:MAG: hypothetical protein ACE5HX_13310 [bacterium]
MSKDIKKVNSGISIKSFIRCDNDFAELLELFKKTSFRQYPVYIERIEGKDNDTLQDNYSESRMYYEGATRHFADWQCWADAKFVKAVIDFFTKISI